MEDFGLLKLSPRLDLLLPWAAGERAPGMIIKIFKCAHNSVEISAGSLDILIGPVPPLLSRVHSWVMSMYMLRRGSRRR